MTLQQISYREFNLHVDIKLGTDQVGEKWVITIKIPKFPQNAIINLIEYQHP